MTERITSAQNQKFKHLLALQEKSRLRRESGLFVVEGERELLHCLEGGFRIRCVFCCPELMREDNGIDAALEGVQRFDISRELYAKAALRGSTEGIVAEVFAKESRLEDLELGDNPLIAVLESVEKPGNLGAVLRSADACGVDAVIVCDPLTDLYNPNLIRASIGAVFTVPCVACSSSEAINWIKSNNIQILTAQLQDSSLYYDCDSYGYRSDRSVPSLASGGGRPYQATYAGPARLSQRFGQRRSAALRGFETTQFPEIR